jgi:hypothetical protein
LAQLETAAAPPRRVSLIICSRDRCEQLARLLARLPVDGLRRAQAELVLVDSASRDGTLALMRRQAGALACPVEVVHVAAPGLGRARNAGIARARGELLVFTDDDCYVAPDYFDALAARFDSERYAYGGGRILRFDPADLDYGVQTRDRFAAFAPRTRLRAGSLQGSNMVIHRRVFERVGLFREDFGSGTPFRCDDIELLARASLAGFAGAYVPELVVHHHHGRRSEATLRRWRRADDISRGAYYAAMIAAGHSAYWRDWRRLSLSRRALRRDPRWLERLGYEVVGAAHLALLRAGWLRRDGA